MESQFNVENCSLQLMEGCTFEAVVGQLQYHHPELILCVEDGMILHLTPKSEFKPSPELKPEGKKMRHGIMEYYFRDHITGNLYCFFGEEASKAVCPTPETKDSLEGQLHLPDEPSSPNFEQTKVSC